MYASIALCEVTVARRQHGVGGSEMWTGKVSRWWWVIGNRRSRLALVAGEIS